MRSERLGLLLLALAAGLPLLLPAVVGAQEDGQTVTLLVEGMT